MLSQQIQCTGETSTLSREALRPIHPLPRPSENNKEVGTVAFVQVFSKNGYLRLFFAPKKLR